MIRISMAMQMSILSSSAARMKLLEKLEDPG